MDTIYDLSASGPSGSRIDFAAFRGRPLLIANTATRCGLAAQFEGLEALHRRFGPQGLVVIGFPSDQFAQEPVADMAMTEVCRLDHGVTFALTAKVRVNGRDTHPVFQFLKRHSGGRLGSSIKWNFTKFLVAPDGRTVRRYAPTTDPARLEDDIVPLLAQAAGDREPAAATLVG